ncbi:hypothetical protein MGWOODY_Smn3095 [hydrothermal vent metagenome]|uniref:Uncharacterized protein n=1 Tax=hydrothermal vent metagenome TaxID=652676 RepID=A0A160TN53_9ZZZZ
MYADVREPGGQYSRLKVDTSQQQDAFVAAVGRLLGLP